MNVGIRLWPQVLITPVINNDYNRNTNAVTLYLVVCYSVVRCLHGL